MIIYEKSIESSFQAVHEAVEEIIQLLTSQLSWLNKKIVFKINFLLREIMNNAVEHGNKFSHEKMVLCRISKESHDLILEVIDEGEGIVLSDQTFDTDDMDTILRNRNRGYPLLMEIASDVTVSGNQVTVVLDLNQEE